MATFPFNAFTPVERRIISEALARHADALDALLAHGSQSNGYSAGDLRSDVELARYLQSEFNA